MRKKWWRAEDVQWQEQTQRRVGGIHPVSSLLNPTVTSASRHCSQTSTVSMNGQTISSREEEGTVLTEAHWKKLAECWRRKGQKKMKQWREKHSGLEGHFLFSGRKASSVLCLSRCGSSLWNLLNRGPCLWFSVSGPVSQPASDPFSLLIYSHHALLSQRHVYCVLEPFQIATSLSECSLFYCILSHFPLTYNSKKALNRYWRKMWFRLNLWWRTSFTIQLKRSCYFATGQNFKLQDCENKSECCDIASLKVLAVL